jgi:hypothetical protein
MLICVHAVAEVAEPDTAVRAVPPHVVPENTCNTGVHCVELPLPPWLGLGEGDGQEAAQVPRQHTGVDPDMSLEPTQSLVLEHVQGLFEQSD